MASSRTIKRLSVLSTVIIIYNVVLVLLCMSFLLPVKNDIRVTNLPGATICIPDDFVGVGIDASELVDNKQVEFGNLELLKWGAALSPGRLRVGGTMSERLVYSRDRTAGSCDLCRHRHPNPACAVVRDLCRRKFLPFFLLTADMWIAINEYCKATGLKLTFSLNVLLRNSKGWDPRNARDLLNITRHNKYEVDFQLGNEPNSFLHVYNISVSPEMLAEDFSKVRQLLDEYGFQNSQLIGPDTTRPQKKRPECLNYMVEFLGNGSEHITARSWHQYYLNSRTATLEDFWNVNTTRMLEEQIFAMKSNTSMYNDIPLWLTETSSSYGGGAPGLSNTYGGAALWIDKLGLAAKNNITTVIRQSLVGGNYSLLDKEYKPLPDYWVTVLFKRLVGNKVLNVDCDCPKQERLYAHCTKTGYMNLTGAITIYGVNLQDNLVKMDLKDMTEEGQNLLVDEYVISPQSRQRLTKNIMINGFHLKSMDDLKPKKLSHVHSLQMPPYAVVFWVIKNPDLDLCK